MIIGGLKSSSSRRRYRKDNREVQLIHTKPSQPLCWSEQPITFSRADDRVHIPDPGTYPLVVEHIVESTQLPQTLIDGGNGLNVIFIETLKKMDFDFMRLTKCDEPIIGIVPGKAACPMRRVSLPITFKSSYLLKSTYRAILGRPMLARFMAVPHYTYLVLNMPTPKGVLTVYNDRLISFKCDNEALEIAMTNACFSASAVMVVEAKKVAPIDLTILE
jgi:hypothetical protein